MMNNPRVSVIIPTHNRVDLLREALDSVARQTLSDFEVIVVDDGSTQPIGDGISDHPTKPMVVRQQWLGPAAARNRGIKHAKADLVAFLDSDDMWDPPKLERFVQKLDADPELRILYGPMRPIDARGQTVTGRTKPCHAGWITEKLFCSSFVHVPTVVCRKELLVREGGFNPSLPVCEDYDLWLRVSTREPFGLIDEPLAVRRLHQDRLSKRCMSRNLAIKATVLQRFYESNAANGRLDRDVCDARLARVCFAAARSAFREGMFQEALNRCSTSRAYGYSALRTIPLLLAAGTLKRFSGNGHRDEECADGGTPRP